MQPNSGLRQRAGRVKDRTTKQHSVLPRTGAKMRLKALLGTASSMVIAGYLLQSTSLSAAESIGIASAVNKTVEGVQGGSTRALSVGSELFQDESVRTGDDSNAQLLFRDQTSVSVGPHSEVKLDKYQTWLSYGQYLAGNVERYCFWWSRGY